jgi:hypothetical protein
VTIELTEEERALLAVLLEKTRQDLRGEIHKTAGRSYREGLQVDERTLLGLLEKVTRAGSWPRPPNRASRPRIHP